MKLSDIAKAVAVVQANHSILIFSRPKLGKTRLAGTAARIKEIRRIFWFDLENGSQTLLNMDLTEEEMDKITLYKLPDTKENPVAIETMLKAFSIRNKVNICDEHGRDNCVECKRDKKPTTPFALSECTHNDLVVIDSGSQLGDSALAATMLGKDSMAKPGWDEYGIQGKWLGDILSVVQQAKHTNFVVLTHELITENEEKKQEIHPLIGTKAFSMKAAKYFGSVIYLYKNLGKHAAASSSVFRPNVVTGSRVNALMEKAGDPDMRTILIEGGILKEGSVGESSNTVAASVTNSVVAATGPAESSPTAQADVKMSLSERLKMKKT